MEDSFISTSVCSSESREYVEIDEELVKELYNEPPQKIGGRRKVPTERQLKILLDLWPTHNRDKVSRAIGVSENTARRWYEEATKKTAH